MNLITFDIEDWFHLFNIKKFYDQSSWNQLEGRVTKNTLYILDELDKFKIKGIFFCLGWIASKYPDLIKEIELRGHFIGTHSFSHKLVFKHSKSEFEYDLDKSLKVLNTILKKDILFYRAPGFSLKESDYWLFEILTKFGIKYDSSIFPGLRFHGGVRSIHYNQPYNIIHKFGKILELPISFVNFYNFKIFYSGGGYFRLLNINLVKKFTKSNEYNMFYFHPRDFDYNQPRMKSSPLSYFRNYVGLKNSKSKFNNLLNNLHFDKFSKDQFVNLNLDVNV